MLSYAPPTFKATEPLNPHRETVLTVTRPRLLYTSFDQVPGPKGASTHIEAFCRALGQRFGDVVLVTPGADDEPVHELWPGVRQLALGCPGDNPIARARVFRSKLVDLLRRQPFDLIHFRSIFEGLPITDPSVRRGARVIYEANGFPSIELKFHYRKVAHDASLLNRLDRQEVACLRAADRVITVSDVNAGYIVQRGVSHQKIRVIRNGVDLEAFPWQPPRMLSTDEPLTIGYSGTLTAWQGIETLIEAVELIGHHRTVELTLMGPVAIHRRRQLDRLVRRLRVGSRVRFAPAGSQAGVCRLLHNSHVSVVPLLAVDRNTDQGCCPLKLVEAMATGCPVIASDLPVVRELAIPERHYWPIRPGDARNLRNVLLELAERRNDVLHRSRAARGHVEQHTWDAATDRLLTVYDDLLASRESP